MTTAITLPTRVHLKLRNLVGLVIATVVATALVTWTIADNGRNASRQREVRSSEGILAQLDPVPLSTSRGIMALTPEQLAAGFGRSPVTSPTETVLAGLTPAARDYVTGITALTPQELAAGFGPGPDDRLDAHQRQYRERGASDQQRLTC